MPALPTDFGAGGGLVDTVNAAGIAGQTYFNIVTLPNYEPSPALKRHIPHQKTNQPPMEILPVTASTRFVRVIVVDPNENISLEDRVIFNGSEKMTGLNDQELFFELDIKNLLAAHNAKRVKVIDKKVKERTEYLEPAKIRDLKMVVVNIATF